jgi:hypothetical protein
MIFNLNFKTILKGIMIAAISLLLVAIQPITLRAQTNPGNKKEEPKNEEKPTITQLIIRLLFGSNEPKKKKYVEVVNQNKSLAVTGKFEGFVYDPGNKKTYSLKAPETARFILLDSEAGEAFYLSGGRIYKALLNSDLTFKGTNSALSVKGSSNFISLIGFAKEKPNAIVALDESRLPVKVLIESGEVVKLEGYQALSEKELTFILQQSVNDVGAVIAMHSPNYEQWDLVLLPQGQDSLGGPKIKQPGLKSDPRWSRDGKFITFITVGNQ